MTEKSRSDPTAESLSMVEVYQIAADIGKDLETLIERFGGDDFRSLMPKVIRTLEYLESTVRRAETQNVNVRNLEDQLGRSEHESDLKGKENVRLVQALEEAAEKKSDDDIFWMKQLTELQKENAFLKEQVSEKDVIAVKERVQEQEAVKVLMVMKQTVDKQRHQLQNLDAEIRQKSADIEALQEQVERLVKLNQDLHQKNVLIQTHAHGLIKEKSLIMTEMKAMEKDMPLQRVRTLGTSSSDTTETQDDGPSTNGMIMIDPNDPDRPRFTVDELYTVLRERDELKFKLFLIEEDIKSTEDALKTSPASPQKSESTIAKLFSSLFKSTRKKSPSVRESDSGSSESNWELLNREDALPTVGYVVGDVKDPEKELIRILKKYQQPPPGAIQLKELSTSRRTSTSDTSDPGDPASQVLTSSKTEEARDPGNCSSRDSGSHVSPSSETEDATDPGNRVSPLETGDARDPATSCIESEDQWKEENTCLSGETLSDEGTDVDKEENCHVNNNQSDDVHVGVVGGE